MATLTPDHYRSATEYSFNEDQTEAIIRTVAYHRHDFPQSVIFFSEREHDKIRSSIATPFQRSSNVGLGSLDRLPLELLFDMLGLLDMHSLFQFRQTNLRSRQMVDSLSQYQRAVSHGLNLFRALLQTRLATDISLLDFDKALCTKTCVFCGQFGGFISILAWKRCCFKCLQESPETQVRTEVIQVLAWNILDGSALTKTPHSDGIFSSGYYSCQPATAHTFPDHRKH
ncbi:F-box domain protein [Penicillium frequentans]|uniref:F-box domain protein n=1 Tax=Penicillium frequentans TaxID=3151616 RepID=A0AAD6GLL4_9EURO|nr:F-box domain protein [Penicillium glabrum]